MTEILKALASGSTLTEQESESLFESLLSGGLDEAQIGAVLAMIQLRRPTIEELTGAARVMRRHVTPVPYEVAGDERLIDTCGTGGAPKTFNVSTAAAIVAASVDCSNSGASRVVVAKHGNRSRTGRGSAEVLGSLGVNVDATPEIQARCLRDAGVCFCFAIHHHPAMRHAIGPRKSLGFPTIFNLLGPLTNPARATRQLIGIYDPDAMSLVAETLQRLGSEFAIVAHARDGLDELSLGNTTDLAVVTDGRVDVESVDPTSLGLTRTAREDLVARDVEHSAELIERVLRADADVRAPTEMVALNAGAALRVAGICESIGEGVTASFDAIRSGRSADTLRKLREASSG